MAAHKIVLLRHGESEWNAENRFTGWADVSLTPKGLQEAKQAAVYLKGWEFDLAYTSVLKRAVITLNTALEGLDQLWIPVVRSWRLNERMYGGLTALNKSETAAKHGEDQVGRSMCSFQTKIQRRIQPIQKFDIFSFLKIS